MKYRTTAKAIREGYGANRILSVGYGGIQNMLSYFSESAYTCGVYGWNFDVYEVHGIAICTGYRGMPAGLSYNEEMLFKFIDETMDTKKATY